MVVSEHVDEIEVFYLPSYSPALNPDEMLNADLQANAKKQAPARTPRGISKSGHQPSTWSPAITTTCRSPFHAQTNSLCSLSKVHVF
ncbi:MAG: hypothetical protein E5299_01880 [Burkholderia gladioli]|nr:MAG: hypothetical protein E5299_01880 [Burkholderia gladioli]